MSLKNMVNNAKAPTRSYSYNLGVGCGLNSMTPGMAAQFWDDMGSYMIRFKPKNEGF
jgi:hypothetical protein